MEEKFSEVNDFISRIEEYVNTRIEIAKLSIVEKGSALLSGLISSLIIGIILLLTIIFISIAASLIISSYYGNNWVGFVFIAGFYLLISWFLLIFKKSILDRPLGDIFIRKMLEDKTDD